MPSVKIAVTSDLHLPITPALTIADLLREVEAHAPDALVIAGDIGESLREIERCLAMARELVSCPVLVVAGNHDLWKRGASSRQLWEKLLPKAVQQAGCVWLEGEAVVLNGVAVVGTIAWYDYSAVDPAIRATPEVFAAQKVNYNMDAVMIDWEWTDPAFAARVAGPFLATLDRLEADPAVHHVVVATHVPLLECQMCRKPHDPTWGFSNAYFGNLMLGRQVLARRKVTHVFSGHTHVSREGTAARENGPAVEARVIPSEYGRPAWLLVTVESAA